jgi:lipopolysaccharide transport system ATP-binding protein
MSDIAIKVEDVGKLYRLGEVGTGTLSQDLKRWWAVTRGKEDPFAKIGETNDRTSKGHSDYVWALKDVSFEVKQGKVLGIIGRNGAGKSTLLKLLSKVTTPSTGTIKVKGRIASLLEVGTGFHPDLTGRENVFLNGAILGMTKREIQSKFDEIVDFAGVERYIDTPVKRYSSGMYVRLAFAVAAFLEPEILIVDEVLAVGDVEFQKKCLGRMKDVSVNDGRTVLFVSHDMRAIKALCQEVALLQNGSLYGIMPTSTAITQYSNLNELINSDLPVKIDELLIHQFLITQKGFNLEEFESELPIDILIDFELMEDRNNFRIGLFLKSNHGELISSPLLGDWNPEMEKIQAGRYVLRGKIPSNILLGNNYYIEMHCSIHGIKNFCAENYTRRVLKMKSPTNYNVNHIFEPSFGYVILNADWVLQTVNIKHAQG